MAVKELIRPYINKKEIEIINICIDISYNDLDLEQRKIIDHFKVKLNGKDDR